MLKQGLGTVRQGYSPAWKRTFGRRLLAWYKTHARDLPWRRTRDPYRVWISEIMLQQTQVATVVPYFERFLEEFPSIDRLAAADEQAVLRAWEGLGYYRRARQLHRAAQIIVQEHDGEFPRESAAVRRLPGIGRYTAGAILSIAFDERLPIVEANTSRLHCRLLAYRGDAKSVEGQRVLWQAAERVLPRRNAGVFNQALMELGATICMPRAPRCEECPVVELCPTHRHGLQNVIPRPAKKPGIEKVLQAAIVLRRGNKLLLIRQRDDERWAGMWDFPRFPLAANDGSTQQVLEEAVRQLTGLSIRLGEKLATLTHSVTRFRITLDCYWAQRIAGRGRPNGREIRWVAPNQCRDLPLSVTGRKLAEMVLETQANGDPRRRRSSRAIS